MTAASDVTTGDAGSGEGTATRTWLLYAFVVAFAAVFVGLAFLTYAAPTVSPFGADDTFITWIYARNLAEGAGLRYNAADLSPTEGFSSLLHVLILSVFQRFAEKQFVPALAVNMLSFLVIPIIVGFGVRRATRVPLPFALMTATLVHVLHFFSSAASTHILSGMETLLFMACVAGLASWSLVEICESDEGRGTTPARAALGLAALFLAAAARPEGVLLGVLSLAAVLVMRSIRAGRPVLFADRPFTVLLGSYGGGLALWALWKKSYFGYLLPNPYYVKVANGIFGSNGDLFPGLGYTLVFLLEYGPWVAGLGCLLFLFRDVRRQWLALTLTVLPGVVLILGFTRAIHEMSFEHRYEFPFLVYAQLAIAYAVGLLYRRLRNGAFVLPLVPAVMALVYFMYVKPVNIGYPVHWPNINVYLRAHAAPAIDLQRTGLGERGTLLTSAAGYIPYRSRWRTIDWIGLNNNYLSGREPRTMDQVWAYIDEQKPDVIFSVLPPATAGSTGPADEPAFASFPIQLTTGGSNPLFTSWNRQRWREMFYREMQYVRDRYLFGSCYFYESEQFMILYVRRDSPYRDQILSTLRSSMFADRSTDLRPRYINDPRALR